MPSPPANLTSSQLRKWALEAHPELANSPVSVLADGWDSVALDVDDRIILKFPRHSLGEEGLRREAAVLQIIRKVVDMPVADLRLVEEPVLHSIHPKLPGVSLLPAVYAELDESIRARLGSDLGRFFAQLHGIDDAHFHALNIGVADAWLDASAIRDRAWRHLPRTIRPWADHALSAWASMGPDPLGTTYGHFDAHGWNLAFDPATQNLSGVLDFGDSGFGPVHREFVYSTLIDIDLTRRIIATYGQLSGKRVELERVLILADIHRLWEIAVEQEDATSVAAMLVEVEQWAKRRD